jgi:RNA-directed DNA polymerase
LRPQPIAEGGSDFLGFTFRPRKARGRNGAFFVGFLPAISNTAAKAKRQQIRRWRLHRWTHADLRDLAAFINPIVRGWINYYGRFYRSRLATAVLQQINEYLIRWALQKYKRLRGSRRRAVRLLAEIARSQPDLFAHWRLVRLYSAG